MAEHPLLAALRDGDRRALAKAITLIESTDDADRAQADVLLTQALPHGGSALRLGISGAPGVGKSTFIEALGLAAIARGRRVAVLAIDPSSTLSGGSILGDKTRMERLSTQDSAFIRPSPSAGTLGGVTSRTRETILLCEAAGYDLVLVETVGVGQSETAAASMTDLFVLLQLPHAGDDLQAIKRGVMELADLVVVNKADLDPAAAQRAAMQLGAGRGQRVAARVVSAKTGEGIEDLLDAIEGEARIRADSGDRDHRRQVQAIAAGRIHHGASRNLNSRPFRILGIQQIAIGAEDKQRLRRLWVDLLGVPLTGNFVSERENVDEDICSLGQGVHQVEIDLMQPLDPAKKPAVHTTPLNHVGLWVDDLRAAVEWLAQRGLRFAPGGIRKGAAGHDVCFIHPKASEEFPVGGEGVLIELVQAPPEVAAALGAWQQ